MIAGAGPETKKGGANNIVLDSKQSDGTVYKFHKCTTYVYLPCPFFVLEKHFLGSVPKVSHRVFNRSEFGAYVTSNDCDVIPKSF